MTSKQSNEAPQQAPNPNNTLSVEGARNKFLSKVQDIVNYDRNAQYGSAEDSFLTIADLWATYLYARFGFTGDLTAVDVAAMMDLMKTARIATNPTHMDSWVDKAGYAACAGGILEQRKEQKDIIHKQAVEDTKELIGNVIRQAVDNISSGTANYFAYYTTGEGQEWKELSCLQYVADEDIAQFARERHYHALRTTAYRVWDIINGWRTPF